MIADMFRTFVRHIRKSIFTGAMGLASMMAAQSPLTTVHSVRALSSQQAAAGREVVLHGVVTTLSGWKNSFFLDDGTAGISIDRHDELPETLQGDRIEVRGHTGAGRFAPIVVADSVRIEGQGKLPEPHVYTASDLRGGIQDSQWVGVRGIVRTAEVKTLWGAPRLMLSVDIGKGTLVSAVVHDFDPAAVHTLPAAAVLLHGACGTVFNDHKQFIGIRLFLFSLRDVKIERPAPKEPYDLPQSSLSDIMQFRNGIDSAQQVKVSGTVTWSKPGTGIYIQDHDQSLFVQSGIQSAVAAGARVEAVGYPSLGTYSPQLENAIFHVVGSAPPMKPIEARASDMIVAKDGFANVPYDSMVVRMKGRLLEHFVRGDEYVLLLQDGSTIFSARTAPNALGKAGFEDGSILEVTGVCLVAVDQAHEPQTFSLLLRSNADIVVLHAAPWWTARYAAWSIAALIILALLTTGFVAFMRRETRMRALVVQDPLTSLYNRRGFLALTQDRWQMAQRQGSTLLLFYIDLDRFKEINDNFGHNEGDLALIRVAALLKECFRKVDVVGRLGGDEFAVAAIGSEESARPLLEERLQMALKQLNEKSHFPFAIQFSIGVVVCDPSRKTTIEEMLSHADIRMYEQKRKQRVARILPVDRVLQTAL